ncbi:MAG: hypothetical protein HC897_01265 [Thermoanaerobaculia bacterium]|nr:hypothetical protein [Thermoanaerobaculia bacterium]
MVLLWKLLEAYITSGWLFAVAHFALLIFILTRFQGIAREASLLESWKPETAGSSTPDRVETLKTLDRFVAECRELAPQGFLVPLTDSSDRLDSIVEGKLSDLYNLINMMLIIGIAGSLFGLFEFAHNSPEALKRAGGIGAGLGDFSEMLSASMAKAFPVGFVGLVLMLALQVAAAWPEGRLRHGVSAAIGRAVDERRRLSRSQANIVQQAVAEISRAMKPLENLEATLKNSINPVVERFGEEMKTSHEYFKRQFEDLSGATGKIEAAVRGVEANVKILEKASNLLGSTLHTAPAVIQKTAQIQEKQIRILESFEETMNQARVDLLGSIDGFGARIDSIISTYKQALVDTQEAIGQYAKGSVDETKDRVKQSVDLLDSMLQRSASSQASHLESVEASIGKIDRRVEEVFGSLSVVVRNDLLLAIEEVSTEAKNRMTELLTDVSGSVRSVADVSEAASRSLAALEALPGHLSVGIQQSMSELHKGVQQQVETLVGAATDRIKESQGLIERLEEKIPELERLMQTFIQNTQSTANRLADQVVGKWLEVSDGFSKNLISATTSLEHLAALPEHTEQQVSNTLRTLEEQLKRDLVATWNALLSDTQQRIGIQIDAMRSEAKDVSKDLREAASDWHRTAREVGQLINETIRETAKETGDRLHETLGKLDDALIQKYPLIISEMENLLKNLSKVVLEIKAVDDILMQRRELISPSGERQAGNGHFLRRPIKNKGVGVASFPRSKGKTSTDNLPDNSAVEKSDARSDLGRGAPGIVAKFIRWVTRE